MYVRITRLGGDWARLVEAISNILNKGLSRTKTLCERDREGERDTQEEKEREGEEEEERDGCEAKSIR